MADARQSSVCSLVHKALNAVNKGISVKKTQEIVEDYLEMALRRVGRCSENYEQKKPSNN